MPDSRHIIDVIYMHLQVAALPCYNICIVLQIDECRYVITVLTILFIRYKAEIKDNRHIFYAIYTCISSHVYRLYRYKLHGYLIASHIKRFVAEWL